jgi:hypothetical protein
MLVMAAWVGVLLLTSGNFWLLTWTRRQVFWDAGDLVPRSVQKIDPGTQTAPDPLENLIAALAQIPAANTALPSSAAQAAATASTLAVPIPSNAQVIGYSVADRPLLVYRFGYGQRERMIVAGIHGGSEWNTVALAEELIAYLGVYPGAIPSDTTLFILPNLNPDGEAREHGVGGRANDHGVDLNRNFPVNWQIDWSRDGCWVYRSVSAGPSPASEPETTALMEFLLGHNVDALLSYHSAALGIFPGGEPPDPDSVSLAEALARVSSYAYPPVDTGCLFTGTLADWSVSIGIAAVDLELTDHSHTDFEQNLIILSAFLSWKPSK